MEEDTPLVINVYNATLIRLDKIIDHLGLECVYKYEGGRYIRSTELLVEGEILRIYINKPNENGISKALVIKTHKMVSQGLFVCSYHFPLYDTVSKCIIDDNTTDFII